MSRSFFTGSEAELASGSQNFSTRISQAAASYNLLQQEADNYAEVNGRWQTAWAACRDPKTRTQLLTAEKNAARDEIRELSSELAKIVDGGANVTDIQRMELGLNVRRKPSPIPAPSESPSVDVVSVKGRTVNVRIHDAAGKTKGGKAAGATAARVYTFIGADYPAELAQWRLDGLAPKAKYEITFGGEIPSGQQVWIAALWVNRRQQPGPMSTPVTTNLQGGGTAIQQVEMKLAA